MAGRALHILATDYAHSVTFKMFYFRLQKDQPSKGEDLHLMMQPIVFDAACLAVIIEKRATDSGPAPRITGLIRTQDNLIAKKDKEMSFIIRMEPVNTRAGLGRNLGHRIR